MRLHPRLLTLAGTAGLAASLLAPSALRAAAPLAATTAGDASAEHRPVREWLRDGARRLFKLRDELDLSAAQKQQIKDVLQKRKPEIVAAAAAIHTQRQHLLAAVRAEIPDETAIRAAAAEMTKAVGDAAVLRAKVRQEVRVLLTPEQKAKVDQALAEMASDADRALAAAAAP